MDGGVEAYFFRKSGCTSVRPGSHSASIGPFRVTRSDGFEEETQSISDSIVALKSVDLFSQKGLDTKKNATSFQSVSFFAKFTAGRFLAALPQWGLFVENAAGIDSVQPRQKARVFSATPFLMDVIRGRGRD